MFGRLRDRLATPPWALSIVAWLTSALVQTGAFGTVDTTRRYQVTRALWRGEPPVPLHDFPDYGLLAFDGRIHAWYGIGQSLVMLPADLLAGALTALVGLRDPLRYKVEAGLVAFATFPAIAATSAVLGYRLLRRLGEFEARAASLGVLGWLLATTVLPYSQVHFENSLELCLALTVALTTFEWARSGDRRLLAVAGLATGLNLLTRLSNLLDSAAFVAGAVAAVCFTLAGDRRRWLKSRIAELAGVWLPFVVASLLVDRTYHVARFGWNEISGTYIHLFGASRRALDPTLPASYPFSGEFTEGFFGPLVSLNRSIFLFDPLALAGLALFGWAVAKRRLTIPLIAMLSVCAAALVGRLLTYATYAHWDGSTSWSSRFTLTPLQVAMLFVIPTYLTLRERLHRALRAGFVVLLVAAFLLQLCAILVNPDLENVQAHCDRGSVSLIADRALNTVRVVFGVDQVGLSRGGCVPEPFQRVHLLPWGNALDLPRPVRVVPLMGWLVLLAAWIAVIAAVVRRRSTQASRTTSAH